MFNYLIVGSGLYGATIAQQAKKAGKSVLVIQAIAKQRTSRFLRYRQQG